MGFIFSPVQNISSVSTHLAHHLNTTLKNGQEYCVGLPFYLGSTALKSRAFFYSFYDLFFFLLVWYFLIFIVVALVVRCGSFFLPLALPLISHDPPPPLSSPVLSRIQL